MPSGNTHDLRMLKTCGLYLYDASKKKFLVCHATNSRWNQWSIPKGLPEGNEEPMAVAMRELMEETGLDISKLNVISITPLAVVKYQKQNKILESFLVIADSVHEEHMFTSNLVAGKTFAEIDAWKWVDLSQMESYLHESQVKNISLIKELLAGDGLI